MPKRRVDDSMLQGRPKVSRDQVAVRRDQVEYILRNGFSSFVSCENCLSSDEECITDRSGRYAKCASCTRKGRLCKRDFRTEEEWLILRRAEDKLSSDIEKNDEELDFLELELGELQNRLAVLHQQWIAKQQQYREAMGHQRRLRKQMTFLKQKGFKMSEHDAALLRILEEQNGEAQSSVETVQLAASVENPSGFTQMEEEIDRFSPSFWETFDHSALDKTAKPVVGSSSGA